MANIGTRLLNQYAAHYALKYLQKVNYQHTGTPKNSSTWKFLRLSGIDWSTDPNLLGQIGQETAALQRDLVLSGAKNTSIRSANRNSPLIAHGPQSWLILTYEQTLKKIFELDQGTIQYGLNKDVYRDIEENVMAARMMFESASKSLAKKIYELYGEIGNEIALIEGGAGNGAATLTNIKEFHEHHKYPHFWLTDIDPKTLAVAENYFRQNGNFQSHHFPWSQLDIGDSLAVKSLLNSFPGFKTILNVNFIVHEWEPIAERFFKATSQSGTDTDLIVSEFFVPENPQVDPDFPWWFVYLHELSGQHLRTENDFLAITKKHGYHVFDQLDYQIHNGKPVTSTIFLRKN